MGSAAFAAAHLETPFAEAGAAPDVAVARVVHAEDVAHLIGAHFTERHGLVGGVIESALIDQALTRLEREEPIPAAERERVRIRRAIRHLVPIVEVTGILPV